MSKNLTLVPIDHSWSFSEKTIKDTSYITHGYYTYPAKFIPQLAERLIKEYSKENDIVIDPFMGSGTTVVESVINERVGIGTDINDIAFLLAKVKTTPLDIKELTNTYSNLEFNILNNTIKINDEIKISNMERIDYWFLPHQKEKLMVLLSGILEIENTNIKNFFLVAFSQILKSCSIWLQKSVKPTRDMQKKIYDPCSLFLAQSRKMIKKHTEFNSMLSKDIIKNIDAYRIVEHQDSRRLPCESEAASLIVSSPPYVTSYEYADLHQLPLLWLGYLDELSEFRKKFIGSSSTEREKIDLKSLTADSIVTKLGNNKKGREVRNYFADMLETFTEIKRVLKRGGNTCIVIGNTEFSGVKILNAEVFQEQFENIGFRTNKIIRREIPSKMLPSTRDTNTGQFVKKADKNIKFAYPTEYILVMEKI